MEAAEAEPTKDTLARAEDAVARLKTPDEELAARTKTVAQTITANEQAAAKPKRRKNDKQRQLCQNKASQPLPAINPKRRSLLHQPVPSTIRENAATVPTRLQL